MQLITTEEASKMLSVAPITMQTWRSKNQGPDFVKIGGSVRYKLTDIESWIEQNTCKTIASDSKCIANAEQMQGVCK